jgi:membrane protein Man1
MIATSPEHHHQMQQRLHQLNEPHLTQDSSNTTLRNNSSSHTASSNITSSRVATSSNFEELKENQPTATTNTAFNSAWQGDAFNRSEKLVHSPTPCLKIRNMFDFSMIDADPLCTYRIHNDILEKCCASRNPHTNKLVILNNSILHISCDKKSKEGCVYVKCSSNEAAGRAYQALNGTWYNGKLLTVKFLRNDRYLERFPESINATKPLQQIQI